MMAEEYISLEGLLVIILLVLLILFIIKRL